MGHPREAKVGHRHGFTVMVSVFEVTVEPPVAALFSDALTVPLVDIRVVEADTTPLELTVRPPPLGAQVT